jgi:hypothetical protein
MFLAFLVQAQRRRWTCSRSSFSENEVKPVTSAKNHADIPGISFIMPSLNFYGKDSLKKKGIKLRLVKICISDWGFYVKYTAICHFKVGYFLKNFCDNLQNLQISNSSKSFDTINVPGSHIENYYVPLIVPSTLYMV